MYNYSDKISLVYIRKVLMYLRTFVCKIMFSKKKNNNKTEQMNWIEP